ncbi:MAG TPA: nicotinate-nucleotide adenylyltransferase [Bacteroidales bacterium]|nr:nicotinate-nucleotide adenylyltransferase [Bacteroidales bacterium]
MGEKDSYRKQIGIFSGSFNPIHMGHVMLANYITEFSYVDEVWFVVTPHNPLKQVEGLADEKSRLEMCCIAVEGMDKLRASDIEFSMPKPSYTIDTLDRLKEEHPELDFTLIVGADNWSNFHLWRQYERIIEENKILIYPRLGEELLIDKKYSHNVRPCNAPILQISSTFIRSSIKDGKCMSSFLPSGVYDYIVTHKLYR